MTTATDRRHGLIGNAAIKVPCRVATTGPITLSGEQTIDVIAVVEGDRVLVKDQASGVDNGIYTVSTGAWSRSTDFDGTYDVVQGTLVHVVGGTVGGGYVYKLTTANPITIGTTSLAFAIVFSSASVSAFMATLLDDADAAAARATLGAAALVNVREDVASATTLDLDSMTGDYGRVTGTTATTAITLTSGERRLLLAAAAWPITHGASLICPGSASYTCAAGDLVLAVGEAAGVVRLAIWKADGTAVVAGSSGAQIQPISASVAGNALTITAPSLTLDFRSATLTSGTVTTVTGDPADLVVSSGSTLGTVSGIASRLAVIAMNNAGTIELAVRNVSAGANLDEGALISTTAEGGAGAADSATVNYSTTARSNLAFRVIGYIESTQATAGTWATSPSTIQGEGGNACAVKSAWVIGTSIASSSQTAIDFTGIPAWATEVIVSYRDGSLNASDYWLLQMGDAGGFETTGYTGNYNQLDVAGGALSSGFRDTSGAATQVRSAQWHFTIVDRATNTWFCQANGARTDGASADAYSVTGYKSLSDTLTQIKLTTGTGTSQIDGGTFNFQYR